jgi:uncharacterized membrane protein HdeD (DUF308 family)
VSQTLRDAPFARSLQQGCAIERIEARMSSAPHEQRGRPCGSAGVRAHRPSTRRTLMTTKIRVTSIDLGAALRAHRIGFRNTGIVLIVLGGLAVLLPLAAALAINLLLGILLLASGVAMGVQAFRSMGPARFWWHFGLAVLYALMGLLLLLDPLQGVVTLTLLLAALLLFEGIVKIALALPMRGIDGWLWLLFSGVITALLGGLILSGLPGSAAWALGLIFGINLLITGVSLVSLAAAAGQDRTR